MARVVLQLAPVLQTLRRHATDVESATACLEALEYLVAIGDVEDEMEEEEILPLVFAALQANPCSAQVAAAGHAVLSCVALRSETPQLAADSADHGAAERFHDFVERRKEQREYAKKVMARVRNQAAGAAFATWLETTQQIVVIKRLVASLLHRELAATLHQWVVSAVSEKATRRSTRVRQAEALIAAGEHDRALAIAEEAVVMGLGLLALARGDEERKARAPIAVDAALDATEWFSNDSMNTEVVSAHAIDLRDRTQAAVQAEAEAAKAARIEWMVHRWRHASILLGWKGWLEYRRRVELCQRVAKRIALRGMHMAFDGWFNEVQQSLAVKELMVRVANTIANLQASRAINRWKEYVEELEAERETERKKYAIEQERKRKEFLLRQLFKNL
eukprot:COSAG02_NODE_6153_length_3763_cov_743.881550_2_plen_392_part_00